MEPTDSDAATEMRSLQLSAIDDVVHPDEFPVTTEELIEDFGDYRVEYPRGSERLEAILRTSGTQTYRTPDEIRLSILTGVGRDAVGRPRYSDRGDEEVHRFHRPVQSL